MAYLDGAMVEIEVEKTGAADDAVTGAVHGFDYGNPGELTGCAGGKSGFEPCVELSRVSDAGEHVAPDARIVGYLLKRRQVSVRKRFEADAWAFENRDFYRRTRIHVVVVEARDRQSWRRVSATRS